jgi:hypothetical protein
VTTARRTSTLDTMMATADEALYRAKAEGVTASFSPNVGRWCRYLRRTSIAMPLDVEVAGACGCSDLSSRQQLS